VTAQTHTICRVCLIRDLKDFDFCHCETGRIGEKSFTVQANVIDVRATKAGSTTGGVCIVVIENTNAIGKDWTHPEQTGKYIVFRFRLQCKCLRWEVVGIFQRENKTLQTWICFEQGGEIVCRFLFHLRESPENIAIHILNQR
jgi:hypothetical protein